MAQVVLRANVLNPNAVNTLEFIVFGGGDVATSFKPCIDFSLRLPVTVDCTSTPCSHSIGDWELEYMLGMCTVMFIIPSVVLQALHFRCILRSQVTEHHEKQGLLLTIKAAALQHCQQLLAVAFDWLTACILLQQWGMPVTRRPQ